MIPIAVTSDIPEAITNLRNLSWVVRKEFVAGAKRAMRRTVDRFFLTAPAVSRNYRANLSVRVKGRRHGNHIPRRWRTRDAYAPAEGNRRRIVLAAIDAWDGTSPIEFSNLAEHAAALEFGTVNMAARAPMAFFAEDLERFVAEELAVVDGERLVDRLNVFGGIPIGATEDWADSRHLDVFGDHEWTLGSYDGPGIDS